MMNRVLIASITPKTLMMNEKNIKFGKKLSKWVIIKTI